MKRADSKTLGVVVTAVLLVLVMVSLIFIFLSGTKAGTEGLNSCEGLGGSCKTVAACKEIGGLGVSAKECTETDKDQICCRTLG
jgi:hypothetical protein